MSPTFRFLRVWNAAGTRCSLACPFCGHREHNIPKRATKATATELKCSRCATTGLVDDVRPEPKVQQP